MGEWNEALHPRGRGEQGGEWIKKVDTKISGALTLDDVNKGDHVEFPGSGGKVLVVGKSNRYGAVTVKGGKKIPIGAVTKHHPSGATAPVPPPPAPTHKPAQKWVEKVSDRMEGAVKEEPKAAPKPVASHQAKLDAFIEHQKGIIPHIVANTKISFRPSGHADLSGGKSNGKVDAINKSVNGKANIFINTDIANQSGMIQKGAVASGWKSKSNAKNSLEHTTAHEIGHSLDHIVGREKMSDALDAVAKALGVEPYRQRRAGSVPYSKREMDVWVQKNKVKIQREVSGYGTVDSAEMFAEIWAEYSLGTPSKPPRRAAQAAGEIMKKAANGRLP